MDFGFGRSARRPRNFPDDFLSSSAGSDPSARSSVVRANYAPACETKFDLVRFAVGLPKPGEHPMCDYSLQTVRSRPAQVGDKLTTHAFGTGTRGFAAAEDAGMAVCVLPGTELSFADDVTCLPTRPFAWREKPISHRTAIFRQINKQRPAAHHDALEFPDGRVRLLTLLQEGQQATVLQLPVAPKTPEEAEKQHRAVFAG